MPTRTTKRDFRQLGDLGVDEILQLLNHAVAMKNQRSMGARRKPLEGRSVALIFEKPSTRTRVSFEVGVYELGGHPVVMSVKDSQLGRGESIEDTARTLSGYVHAIVMRTFGRERLDAMARAATVPVINALTDDAHPCQILADLLTVLEVKRQLRGLRYAWIGDGNNVARSWAEAAGLLGLDLVMATTEGRPIYYRNDTPRTGANHHLTLRLRQPEGANRYAIGAEVRVGGVVLHVEGPTVRCAMPLRAQPGGLAKEPGIFQALSELNELAPNHLGLYCSVAEPGTVAVGDAISLFG